MDASEYCRAIESHLCRRNAGHLVRIAGPAFDLVRGWAERGIPLKVALQGIDRCVERAEARNQRRRPIRVEFAEADVLDAFDAWRRAVGLWSPLRAEGDTGDEDTAAAPAAPRRPSLQTHIDRTIARLTALRAGPGVAPEWNQALERAVARLDATFARAHRARGAQREAILADLEAVDAELLAAARQYAPADAVAGAAADAAAELEPFRGRLSSEAHAAALARCEARMLRQLLGVPTAALD